jgi:lysozyme family protein
MSFDSAFARTVGIEGRYSNNPKDPGGETMWGITVAMARAHGYVGQMKDMPIATAKAIYLAAFWMLLHLDQVDTFSPRIAEELFDTAVNLGQTKPIPFLQRALNAFNREGRDYPDIPVDGLAGAKTIDALRQFLAARSKQGGEAVLVAALNAQQAEEYLAIVGRRPASEDFIFGWFKKRVALAV